MKILKKKTNSQTSFYDYKKDGITQGILHKFMECRKAAKLFLDGWSRKGSSMGLTYGEITHECLESVYVAIRSGQLSSKTLDSKAVKKVLQNVEQKWYKNSKGVDASTLQMAETSFLIAEATLPEYFKFWKKQDTSVKWEQVEKDFKVPYVDLKGRKTFIRGKRDGAFSYKNEKGIWLFETKTKSRIEEGNIAEILPLDLQINTYQHTLAIETSRKVLGTMYNIIRRVCLQQKKNESNMQYAKRCAEDIIDRPEFYFIRMEVGTDDVDMKQWKRSFDGLVTDFIDWREGISPDYYNSGHCMNKYGRCDYVNICTCDDFTGFKKREQMYVELEESKS